MPPRYRGLGQVLAALTMVVGAVQVIQAVVEAAEEYDNGRMKRPREENQNGDL